MGILLNIKDVYNTYFQKPYKVGENSTAPEEAVFKVDDDKSVQKNTIYGVPLSKQMNGREVFLPVKLVSGGITVEIACCTIRCNCEKTIVSTPVSERHGTVKELYCVGDWKFTIKGVLMAEHGKMPDEKMIDLKDIFESTLPVELHNALSDLVLDHTNRVAVRSLEFPEVEGKSLRHRPFILTCESDFVDSLNID